MKKSLLIIAMAFMTIGTICAQQESFQRKATLPAVDLKTLDGQTFNTRDIQNEGNPIIISLWATWCMPCREELDAISLVYEEWMEETGVKLYAISVDDSRSASKVAPFVRAKGWEYEVLQDVNSDFKRAMNVTDIPFLCIVNGKGEIVWSHTSYASGGEEEVYEIIKKLKEEAE